MKKQNVKYYLAGVVSLLTFMVYLASLQNEFINWDDNEYVYENPFIRSFNPAFFRWAFFNFYSGNWHPLTWMSHALDYAIWGLSPLGHHLSNNILHAVNTFVVVVMVAKLVEAWRGRPTKNGPSVFLAGRTTLITAGVTGLLFGLHPVHVESVAWVAERKDLLCALFFLLSITMYTNYISVINKETVHKTFKLQFLNKQYMLSFAFFILALLSKPMAVTLPFVLLILDWYPFDRIQSLRTFQNVFVEKLPFVACSLALSVLTILAQAAGGAIVSTKGIPLSIRALVSTSSLIAYLWKMIAPLNLSPFYPYPRDVSPLSLDFLSSFVLVIGITGACIFFGKKQKLWGAVWGYYVLTLIPVIGIVQVGMQAMADRYTYLPSIGPFMLAGLAVAMVFKNLDEQAKGHLVIKIVSVAAVAALFILSTFLTVKQIGIWKNSINLWDHVIAQEQERVPIAYYFRGLFFSARGQLNEAVADFDRAISLYPLFYDAYNHRGTVLEKMGLHDAAIDNYNIAIGLKPSDDTAYYNRGLAFDAKGQPDRAMADFDKAIALNPTNYDVFISRGILYGKTGLFDKAIEDFNKSMVINPDNFLAVFNRGYAYLLKKQNDLALEDFNKSIKLNNNFATAHFIRGSLYFETGNINLAVSDFQKACDLGDNNGCQSVQETQLSIRNQDRK